jgi:hypothetical protein
MLVNLHCSCALHAVPADVAADANGPPAGAAPLGSPSSVPSEASELVDPLQEAAGVQLSRRNSFEVSVDVLACLVNGFLLACPVNNRDFARPERCMPAQVLLQTTCACISCE